MPALAHVAVHSSQFPEIVRRELLESLRTRQVNHKFLYDSVKQTQKWLALHQACSPSRTDADCAAIYDRSFAAVAERLRAPRAHVLGLGCGGGQKDTRLLRTLREAGREICYTPSDVSTAMVLVARTEALTVIPEHKCFPLVCDLATADDLADVLDESTAPSAAASPRVAQHASSATAQAPRLITFFGMLPNFAPETILPKLATLVRSGDWLLMSANLAPGPDYNAGVRRILPLYDNTPTRDWLMAFLLDLGVEAGDGELRFSMEDDPAGLGLKRVIARFHFRRSRRLEIDAERFEFRAGEAIRLFFSYRHTPALVRAMLAPHGLRVLGEWVARSEEEGVFLLGRD